jgi:hypothetical protein
MTTLTRRQLDRMRQPGYARLDAVWRAPYGASGAVASTGGDFTP